MSSCAHVVEHGVASAKAVIGIDARIIERGGLEHSHEDGSLVGSHCLGSGAEIGLARCLYAEGV